MTRTLSRPGSGRGIPQPRLPDGAEVTNDHLLDQLRYLETKAESRGGVRDERENTETARHTFTEGSSWEDVVAAQGLPSRTSTRPHFYEERWFYGSSWVVLRRGKVVSWHDAGELESVAPADPFMTAAPSPRSNEAAESIPRAAEPTLVELARRNARARDVEPRQDVPAAIPSGPAPPSPPVTVSESSLRTPSAALRQSGPWKVFLTDGQTLDGYVRNIDNGLAHVVLFLANDKTLLATLPEELVDSEASHFIAPNARR